MQSSNRFIWYLFLGVLAFLLVFFVYTFFKEDKIKNYPSTGTDIIAFGDSLIEGVGASSEENNFISILSKKIGRPIVNLGVSGNTTADGLSRLNELDKYKPKVVVLLLGGNDHLKKVPIEETFTNLGKIIEDIQSRGAVVLLLGVRGSLLSDKFKSEFEEIKDKYETAHVPDVLSGLFADSRYMADAVHPNDAGYIKIADRVYPVLSKILR